jgi:YidC/Oxa1 family membrane protein insertase
MGVSTVTPAVMKFMSYFLPAISLAFTFWLPAAVQLSFVTTGLLSFGQAELFKNRAFRERFNMYTLGTPAAPGPALNRGTIDVKGRTLSQEDINKTYTGPTGTQSPEFQAGKESLQNLKPRGTMGKVVDGALKDIKGTFKEVKTSAKGVVEAGKEQFGRNKGKE